MSLVRSNGDNGDARCYRYGFHFASARAGQLIPPPPPRSPPPPPLPPIALKPPPERTASVGSEQCATGIHIKHFPSLVVEPHSLPRASPSMVTLPRLPYRHPAQLNLHNTITSRLPLACSQPFAFTSHDQRTLGASSEYAGWFISQSYLHDAFHPLHRRLEFTPPSTPSLGPQLNGCHCQALIPIGILRSLVCPRITADISPPFTSSGYRTAP